MQAIAGVLFTPDEKQTLGLTVLYATPITYDLTYISEPYSYKAKSPWSVSAGYSRTLSQSIKALAGIEFQNWMDVTQNVRNKIQYHVGVVIDPSTTDELRFGLFTEIDPRTHIAANSGKYFLSGGYEKRVGNLKLGLSILDSHLFDLNPGENVWGTDVRETDISLGASYLIK